MLPIYIVTLTIIIIVLFALSFIFVIDSYLSVCNTIYNNNRMQNHEPSLKKYWSTQSGYFRLAATVALSTRIIYGMLLLCYGISDKSKENKISTRE